MERTAFFYSMIDKIPVSRYNYSVINYSVIIQSEVNQWLCETLP